MLGGGAGRINAAAALFLLPASLLLPPLHVGDARDRATWRALCLAVQSHQAGLSLSAKSLPHLTRALLVRP